MDTNYKINNFISLKLDGKKTNLYLKNKLFKQCKLVIVNINPSNNDSTRNAKSIDEVIYYKDENLSKDLPYAEIESFDKGVEIDPKIEFWAHFQTNGFF